MVEQAGGGWAWTFGTTVVVAEDCPFELVESFTLVAYLVKVLGLGDGPLIESVEGCMHFNFVLSGWGNVHFFTT